MSISFCLDPALTSKTQSLHLSIKSLFIGLLFSDQVEEIIISESFTNLEYWSLALNFHFASFILSGFVS